MQKKLMRTYTSKVLGLILNLLCMAGQLDAQILIFTHSYNRPDFIEVQYKTFRRFLLDKDYEFIVFNDATDKEIHDSICGACIKYGLQCIDIPQEIHSRPYLHRTPDEGYLITPNTRCANVIQYSLDILGLKHDDIVFVIDSDMFLVKEFSIREYMRGYDISGVEQARGHVNYLWNGILFFDMRTLPNKETINVNCGIFEGQPVDVGGYLYYYLKAHPNLRIKPIGGYNIYEIRCEECRKQPTPIVGVFEKCTHNTQALKMEGCFDDDTIKFIQEHICNSQFYIHGTFYHYGSGTNWNMIPHEVHQYRTDILRRYVNYVLNR